MVHTPKHNALFEKAKARNARLRLAKQVLDAARCPACGGRPVDTPEDFLWTFARRLTCSRCACRWPSPPVITVGFD